MAQSYQDHDGNDSSTNFGLTFGGTTKYLKRAHIKLYYGRDRVAGTATSTLNEDTDYKFIDDNTIQLIGSTLNTGVTVGDPYPLPTGTKLTIERQTPQDSLLVPWADGSNLTKEALETSNLQVLFGQQEEADTVLLSSAKAIASETASTTATNDVSDLRSKYVDKDGSVAFTGDIDAGNNKLENLATPTEGTDGTTKTYVDTTAATKASETTTVGTLTGLNVNGDIDISNGEIKLGNGDEFVLKYDETNEYALVDTDKLRFYSSSGVNNFYIGDPNDNTADDLIFSLTGNGISVGDKIWPADTNTIDLGWGTGGVNKKWRDIYAAGTVECGNIDGDAIVTSGDSVSDTKVYSAKRSDAKYLTSSDAAGNLTGTTLASGVTASSLTSVGTLSNLNVSGTTNFNGLVNLKGIQTTIGDSNTDVVNFSAQIGSALVPTGNRDLGDSTNSWQHLYLSGNITAAGITGGVLVDSSEHSSATVDDTTVFSTAASDARYFIQTASTDEVISSGYITWPTDGTKDNYVATPGAIDQRIQQIVDDVGGFVAIANEGSFPASHPDPKGDAGTIVSITALSDERTASSGSGSPNTGVLTTGFSTTGSPGQQVTINGCPNDQVFAAGYGLLVQTTSTEHTYDFVRYVPNTSQVATVAANTTNIDAVATNTANINNVAGKATEIENLGTTDAVADLAILGTTDVVADLETCADNLSDIQAAPGHATTASTKASEASTSAANAQISYANAAFSAANSNISAVSAAASEALAKTYRDGFNSIYLGSQANDPIQDSLSSPVTAGDIYQNSTEDTVKVFNGKTWNQITGQTAPIFSSTSSINQGIYDAYAVIQDEKADMTAGGSASATTWQTRDLNTEHIDPKGLIVGFNNQAINTGSPKLNGGQYTETTAANQFALATGTYLIKAKVPCFDTGGTIAEINQADASDGTFSNIARAHTWNTKSTSAAVASTIEVQQRVVLTSTKFFNIKMYSMIAQSTDGLGQAHYNNVSTNNVYTVVEIYRESSGTITATKGFQLVYTSSAGNNSIDLGTLPGTSTGLAEENISTGRLVSLAEGPGTTTFDLATL